MALPGWACGVALHAGARSCTWGLLARACGRQLCAWQAAALLSPGFGTLAAAWESRCLAQLGVYYGWRQGPQGADGMGCSTFQTEGAGRRLLCMVHKCGAQAASPSHRPSGAHLLRSSCCLQVDSKIKSPQEDVISWVREGQWQTLTCTGQASVSWARNKE